MNVLSLFDGMSCGRLTLQRLGIKPDLYIASEIDKYAIKVAQANFTTNIQYGDVSDITKEMLPDIDLLIGGSPCQGFSFAGGQAGTKAELNGDTFIVDTLELYLTLKELGAKFLSQSHLFWEYVRLLREIKPKFFFLENVKMKKEYLQIITNALGVEPVFINSALVSAQNRQRYYWCDWEVPQPDDKGIMLRDILEHDGTGWIKNHGAFTERNEKSQCLDANYHKGVDNHGQRTMIKCGSMVGRRINPETGVRDDYNRSIKPQQRIEVRRDDKTNCLTTVQKDNLVIMQKARGNNKGGIRAKDGKTPCLSANSWQNNNHLTDGVQYRKLTPIECERLQGVPDNYTNHVSNTQRYKMLGNGWQVDTIEHIFSYCPLIIEEMLKC